MTAVLIQFVLETVCMVIVCAGGLLLVVAVCDSFRRGNATIEHPERELTPRDDRAHVRACYRAGGWNALPWDAQPCRSGHTDCTVDCGWCKGTGWMR